MAFPEDCKACRLGLSATLATWAEYLAYGVGIRAGRPRCPRPWRPRPPRPGLSAHGDHGPACAAWLVGLSAGTASTSWGQQRLRCEYYCSNRRWPYRSAVRAGRARQRARGWAARWPRTDWRRVPPLARRLAQGLPPRRRWPSRVRGLQARQGPQGCQVRPPEGRSRGCFLRAAAETRQASPRVRITTGSHICKKATAKVRSAPTSVMASSDVTIHSATAQPGHGGLSAVAPLATRLLGASA